MAMVDRPEKKRDALLVLGMHRSGTSAVALAFGQLGWQLGRDPLDTQPEINRDGFGENRAVVEFNEAILSRFDRRWYHMTPLPAGWWQLAEAGDLVENATEVLRQQYSDTDRLLLKDPRLCLTLPVWLEALGRFHAKPRILVVSRHPESVARSLAKRDRLPLQIGHLLWLYYYLCAFRDSKWVERRVIRYEDVLARGAVALSVFEDIHVPGSIDLGLDPLLCHHANESFSCPGEITELCERLLASMARPTPDIVDLPAPDRLLGCLGGETTGQLVDACLGELVRYSGEAVEVGQQHSVALETICERDAQLAEKNAELDATRHQFLYRVLRKMRLLR